MPNARSSRQRRTTVWRRELRSLILSLCAAAGGTGGLLLAVHRGPAPPAHCTLAKDCVARGLSTGVMHVLMWTGGLALAGAAVGLVIVRLCLWDR